MAPKFLLFVMAAFLGAVLIHAQAAPAWADVPQACADSCSQTVEVAYLCENQYTDITSQYGCFCSSFPSDAATCATCLNSNDAAALATLLTGTQTACPAAVKSCFFQCSFDTCGSSDIACQCSAKYLNDIYNCASCNTANGNTGVTLISDWQSLDTSCKAQSYSGADASPTTQAAPSATGFDAYVAPSLTATGGGDAATGDLTATAAPAAGSATPAAPAAGSATPAGAVGNPASGVAAAASGGVAAASSPSAKVVSATGSMTKSKSTASAAVAVAASASASPMSSAKSAAQDVVAPAFGALAAVLGSITFLF